MTYQDKIISLPASYSIAESLHEQKKTIVVVGGCFDIIHSGHVAFLDAAKRKADRLFILLESDENVKRFKGPNRPINLQHERALVLSGLASVDHVVTLSPLFTNKDYDDVLIKLKPAIIATTKPDHKLAHKKRQAAMIEAKVVEVIDRIEDRSSSVIVETIKNYE